MTALDQRPRFFEGQYLTAEDLDSVVQFLRGADLRHVLGAHTWGIAIGLDLVERPSPGPANRRDVILQPGFAWDGFGRAIVVAQPVRLPESLFSDISFNPALDDTTANGKGRAVKVWLTYDEIGGRPPASGFETCAEGDVSSRVRETFRIVIGDVPSGPGRRAPIDVGGEVFDAKDALKHFNPSAPDLFDTSVPHQTPPGAARPPRWLVPVGLVRWIARDNSVGYFVDLDLDPSQKGPSRSRAFRRYAGLAAEYVEAADGAIVLHQRSEDPDKNNGFKFLQQSGQPLEDLVWVEGSLRVGVGGHLKMAGGEVRFRDAAGDDQTTPLYLARRGDTQAPGRDRELCAVIGPDGQDENRFVVGREQAGGPPALVAPQFVVVSSGDIGLGRRDPKARLNVTGPRIRLQDDVNDGSAKILELCTDVGTGVDLRSERHPLYLRAAGVTPNNSVLINPDGGKVGVRIDPPGGQFEVDVKAKWIKLGLEEDGGGQLVLGHNPNDNKIFLEGWSADGQANAAEMLVTGRLAAPLPQFRVMAGTTIVDGTLGVGTQTPQERLHVKGDRIRLESADGLRIVDLRTDGSSVDLQTTTGSLFLRSTAPAGQPARHIAMNSFPGDGNVGVGTASPQEKLHVAGPFLRVDGANNEQAYVGGDGSAADVQIGSLSSAVNKVTFWNAANGGFMDIHYRDEYAHSDVHAKEKIEPVADALSRLLELRGVSFEWKGERSRKTPRRRLGLVAQEVEKVLPEVVAYGREGGAVSYTALVPLLIEAVKELKAEVDDLRERIEPKPPRKPRRRRAKRE